jgi:hypothetical protein
MKRLELIRQLAATPEGIEMIDAMLLSFTGRGVDRRVATLCGNPKVRALSMEYVEALKAARRSRA